jgi:hypothetical protein
MTFETDEARRAYFLGKLAEKLRDPEFRGIEGFPLGEDEHILRISDPPYFTACPNPFLADLISCYGTPYDPAALYEREPLAVDVSEGRKDELYNAHPYHTKVPPLAIARYLMHFTSPGDIVLDGFSGAGMTGVACMLCSDEQLAARLGGKAGHRVAILCDLAPVATFISSVYLSPPDAGLFADASDWLLEETQRVVGSDWTWTGKEGRGDDVDFQIWTEVFGCPICQGRIASELPVEATDEIGTAKEFACPHCGALVSKAPSKGSSSSRLERRLHSQFDPVIGHTVPQIERQPVFAQIRAGKATKKVRPTAAQAGEIAAASGSLPPWFPTDPVIEGERYKLKDCCDAYGITHVHHFYLPRQLRAYGWLWQLAQSESDAALRAGLMFYVQSNGLGMTVLNRFGPTHYSQVNRHFSGTLYIPSLVAETSPKYAYTNKRNRLVKAFARLGQLRKGFRSAITTQSSTALSQLPDACVDYVFVDPPFGRNLQYSELNQIWESWLRVKTNRIPEAVMDATRQREEHEYTSLMRASFGSFYRVLKPGRWITIEFHNSSNAVWLAIQEALMEGGFVVADVRTLDKQGETYKQSRQGLVKQDLVISAYKPTGAFEERFRLEAGTAEGAWAFTRSHLQQLPVFVAVGGEVKITAERLSYLLFDRMVAFHVLRGIMVPLSFSEFEHGLEQRFPKREGMYFLPEQVAQFDRKRMVTVAVEQLEMFVHDEASAIQWLRGILNSRPLTNQDLTPLFMREIAGWEKYEKRLELLELLQQNFLRYDGTGDVPNQIHSYLSTNFKELRKLSKDHAELRAKAKERWYVPDPGKAGDLEKLREKTLLQEFWEYLPPGHVPTKPEDAEGYLPGLEPKAPAVAPGRKMKVVRLEAVRVGFKYCWQNRDYKTIIAVAQRIPEDVLQEDPKLLMWYDQALTRSGAA